MKNFKSFFALVLALSIAPKLLASSLIPFQPQQNVKSQTVNQNFNVIKSALADKNTPVVFKTFAPGELIEKSIFETEFDKGFHLLGVLEAALEALMVVRAERVVLG